MLENKVNSLQSCQPPEPLTERQFLHLAINLRDSWSIRPHKHFTDIFFFFLPFSSQPPHYIYGLNPGGLYLSQSYIPSHFYFFVLRQGLAPVPRMASNLRSSCFSPSNCSDYRYAPPSPAIALILKGNNSLILNGFRKSYLLLYLKGNTNSMIHPPNPLKFKDNTFTMQRGFTSPILPC